MMSSASLVNYAHAEDDPFASERASCIANSAKEWNAATNRCMQKQAAMDRRHDIETCDDKTKYPNATDREKCHMDKAKAAAGPEASQNIDDMAKEGQGNKDAGMVINAAYTAIALFNGSGPMWAKSTCTSKQIFGVTAIAGIATDIWLKMEAEKKVKDLKDKFKLDSESSASGAQVKALEFLKEEQQTIADIASKEAKRDMLLSIGYGAAMIAAFIELYTTPLSSVDVECLTPEQQEARKADAKTAAEAEKAKTAAEKAETIKAEAVAKVNAENAAREAAAKAAAEKAYIPPDP